MAPPQRLRICRLIDLEPHFFKESAFMKYKEYQQRVNQEQILEKILFLASDALPEMSPSYYLERLEAIKELATKGIGQKDQN